MQILNNFIVRGAENKPILVDVFYSSKASKQPIAIFCHGYKGFKDWGAWNIMAAQFAKAGICLVKFNFSHNGGTVEEPIDFPDLESFGNNNYSKELEDLECVITWCNSYFDDNDNVDTDNIVLIGHSRGGGISCIKTSEDERVKKLVTLAGVSDFKSRFGSKDDINLWKKDGVKFVENGRTKQQMPLYYQFYQDFLDNELRFNIEASLKNLKVPHLIIHGVSDETVDISEAENLHAWSPNSKLLKINDADHVFNTYHPWKQSQLSESLNHVVSQVIKFIL